METVRVSRQEHPRIFEQAFASCTSSHTPDSAQAPGTHPNYAHVAHPECKTKRPVKPGCLSLPPHHFGALRACTTLRYTVHTEPAQFCAKAQHPAAPTTARRHPSTRHPLSPKLTVYLRGLPFPGRDLGHAILDSLCPGSCKATLHSVTVPNNHSFSRISRHGKAKSCREVQYLVALGISARPGGPTFLGYVGLGWHQGTGEPVWVPGLCWRSAGLTPTLEHHTGSGHHSVLQVQSWLLPTQRFLSRAWD